LGDIDTIPLIGTLGNEWESLVWSIPTDQDWWTPCYFCVWLQTGALHLIVVALKVDRLIGTQQTEDDLESLSEALEALFHW
jgi:hypothetical protein